MQIIRGKKLKQIFADHWQQFAATHPGIRPAIHKNVQKMLLCGTEAAGFHRYQCPQCKEEKIVAHTCKSRFCSSCGVGQTERWIERYTILFANTAYRHMIFHPPSEFRPFFGIDREPYFNMLYTTINQTLA
ncbi:MAG: transposase zinc-binding domain-containing protein [Acidobacteria bacterium]|nr:transposase zinc-binding domain-containing protein [Acidobacteriota bacterium]MBV9479637.1 transposase zinc-binding domain-containing protein [Acidobacteriota bacterium]